MRTPRSTPGTTDAVRPPAARGRRGARSDHRARRSGAGGAVRAGGHAVGARDSPEPALAVDRGARGCFPGARPVRLGDGDRRAARGMGRAVGAATGAGREALAGACRATDRAGSAEVAAAAVQGIEGLEPYFARYLPQVVLACVVPPIVIAGAALADTESALIMLITLPLVPVFMWLIGRYTEQRAIERWQALHMLSAHFLDVVRGLPTLRTFGRAEAQIGVLADVGERYRATTMQTLRVSFLSGSVLELAATLGVALVAVTAGVRLVDGSLGLQAGLTVLVLAPGAVPAVPPPRRRVPRERRRSRRRRAHARPPRRGRPSAARRPMPRPQPGSWSRCCRAGVVLLPVAPGDRARPCESRTRARRDSRAGRRQRRRQEHHGRPAARPDRPDRGPHNRGRRRPGRLQRSSSGVPTWRGCRSTPRSCAARSATTSGSASPRRRTARFGQQPHSSEPTISSRRCPTAIRRWWGREHVCYRPESGGGSGSPEQSFATRRS